MKLFLEIDTINDNEESIHNVISILYKDKNQNMNPGQQPLQTASNPDTISIVLRDGDNNKTFDVKEQLKKLGFNYYKYKKNTQIEDNRYTLTTTRDRWKQIKDNEALNGLNIWTSDMGEY